MDKGNLVEEIIIKRTETPLIIKTTLTLFMVISFLIPILATFFVLTQDIDLHFGIIFSYLLFWGLGIYLLRVVLWNVYGQEILTLEKNKIKYVADFKFFKDGRQEISVDALSTEIIYEDTMDLSVGRIRLVNYNFIIETALKSTLTELERINKKITTHYNCA